MKFYSVILCGAFLQDVLEYSMVDKEPDTSYFFLHPHTGELTLSRALSVDTQTEYRVRQKHAKLKGKQKDRLKMRFESH